MPFEVVMPRLGWTMEKGRLVGWFKNDGEYVQAGEILFSVETDKAIQEVEALESGLLRIPPDSPRLGEEVPVGTLLAYLVQPGEFPPFEVERDVRQAAPAREQEAKIKASPVARRLAEEAGIDLAELAAQKSGVRIQREDVEAVIAARQAVATPPPAIPAVGEAVPVTHIRRIIAQRMVESVQTTASLTLTTEADATELVALHEQLKATLAPRGEVVPTYTDLITKLTGVALQEYPMLNAYWKEDEIIVPADIHITIAVDTEAGLLIPVIRDVPSKSIQQIAEESHSLAERARTSQLGPDDLQGGTFTITNLGMYGIDAFTPIINLPQCAILGIGRIISKPAVWNAQIVPRKTMTLSLTFDHRVVDGGPAARFLNTVRKYVEQPYLWLAV